MNNVLTSLRGGNLPASREQVSLIVGRDARQLDSAGVSAAALESLAESFNDGIVAPAFWFVIGGLPGLFAYEALSTADSTGPAPGLNELGRGLRIYVVACGLLWLSISAVGLGVAVTGLGAMWPR